MKNKFIKRSVAIISVFLTVLLALPFQAFASGGTYAVYEDFNSQSSVNGFVSAISINTDGNASGQIKLVGGNGDKYLMYDKSQNITDKAFYTDVYFGNKNTKCPEGTSFVFEVTFWYTGDISTISWGELVGGRKEIQKTDKNGELLFKDANKTIPDMGPDMKCFLQIKNGSLYTGAGTETADLVTKLEQNKKYKISIAVHDADNKYDVYVGDDAQVAIQKNVSYTKDTGTYFTWVRALNLTGMKSSNNIFPDFYADDFKIYYADKPVCAGGVPSSTIGGATTGGGETGDSGNAGTQIPNDPVIPNTPTVPNQNTQTGSGTIKLPMVEQKEFEFTAAPQSTSKVESNPVKLEVKKDIIFISAIGGGSLALIVLMKVFRKRIK